LSTGGYFSTHFATIKTDGRSGEVPKLAFARSSMQKSQSDGRTPDLDALSNFLKAKKAIMTGIDPLTECKHVFTL